jgi:mRNA interferase HicA
VKRHELLRGIARAARTQGVVWQLDRQGASHEIWRCGGLAVTVPRHRELNDVTAAGICRKLETVLGKDWWRR